jgi:hypothetical protein
VKIRVKKMKRNIIGSAKGKRSAAYPVQPAGLKNSKTLAPDSLQPAVRTRFKVAAFDMEGTFHRSALRAFRIVFPAISHQPFSLVVPFVVR